MVNQEIKIHKMESKWSITKKCLEEIEKKLTELEDKSLRYKGNEKIEDEMEITMVKLKQKRKKSFINGLARYNKDLKSKHQ